jgi:hypothetical protein
MKLASVTFILFAAGTGFASPVLLEKRAAITDKATIGFATLNGGQVLMSQGSCFFLIFSV